MPARFFFFFYSPIPIVEERENVSHHDRTFHPRRCWARIQPVYPVTFAEKRTQRGRMRSRMHFRRHWFRQQTNTPSPGLQCKPCSLHRNGTRDQMSMLEFPLRPRSLAISRLCFLRAVSDVHAVKIICTSRSRRSRDFFAVSVNHFNVRGKKMFCHVKVFRQK